MRRWSPALLMVVVALSAGACASDPADDTAGPEQTTKPGTTPTPTPPPKLAGVERELPTGKQLRSHADLYQAVALDDCTKVRGGWQARGTATNATDEPLDFSILVVFTDAQARAVDFARATVEAVPGSSARWTATRTFPAPPEVGCVVRAVKPLS